MCFEADLRRALRKQIIAYFQKRPTKQAIYNKKTTASNENFQCRTIRIIIFIIGADNELKTHRQQISLGRARHPLLWTEHQHSRQSTTKNHRPSRRPLADHEEGPSWPRAENILICFAKER